MTSHSDATAILGRENASLLRTGLNHGGISTYDKFSTFSPKYVVECKLAEDVRRAVAEASASGLRVRPMGMGLSWAPHVQTSDVCLATTGLNLIHHVDVGRKTITADAGARLGDVSHELALHGLSLPSLSFFPEVTIGGAIATATHGTSHKWGSLSDFVLSMDIVLASGELKRLGPESPPEELQAARVAIGMLGVIVRVELQAVAMPWVRFVKLSMDLPAFIRNRQLIMNTYEHIWVHWKLGTEEVKIECLETSPEPKPDFHRYVDYRNGCWAPPPILKSFLQPGWRRLREVFRGKRSVTESIVNSYLREQSPTDAWVSMQYSVPARQMETIIDRIRASDVFTTCAGRIVEMKFLKGEPLFFLGPNADGDAVLFNVWWLVKRNTRATVLRPFEEITQRLHARIGESSMQRLMFPICGWPFRNGSASTPCASASTRQGHS